MDPRPNRQVRARPQLGGVRLAFAPWEDPQARPLVRFEGVAKRFGEVQAVNDVSLDIACTGASADG